MPVLVAVASRYGATGEIARTIGRVLTARGVPAEVRAAEAVSGVAAYEAVVLGSAVYAGRWLEPARRLAEVNAVALGERPVWLFSSGPVGDPPVPLAEPLDVPALMLITGAREHRVFAGRLGTEALTGTGGPLGVAVRGPAGDFRDWAAVERWAASIAVALRDAPVAG